MSRNCQFCRSSETKCIDTRTKENECYRKYYCRNCSQYTGTVEVTDSDMIKMRELARAINLFIKDIVGK